MKWTLPSFLLILVFSLPIYGYLTFTNWGLLFGNIAEVIGLCFVVFNFLSLLSYYDRNHPLRSVWASMALGGFIWLLGQCLEIYCELILRMIAYGTVADALWVLGYFPLIYGFHNLLLYKLRQEQSSGWMMFRNILFASVIFYLAMFTTLILPQFGEPDQPVAQMILDFSYPTLDFVLIVQCLLLLQLSRKHTEFFTFSILSAIAFFTTLLGDGILSFIKDFQSFVYLSVDVYYLVCYFLFAIAAYQCSRYLEKKIVQTV